MSERLDEVVERLARAPSDRALDDLEAHVRREVRRRRVEARAVSALTPARVASVGVALAVGLLIGASVAAPSPGRVIWATNLAPSTLLEGWR